MFIDVKMPTIAGIFNVANMSFDTNMFKILVKISEFTVLRTSYVTCISVHSLAGHQICH